MQPLINTITITIDYDDDQFSVSGDCPLLLLFLLFICNLPKSSLNCP